MHLPASGSTPGRWGPQDSTGTTPPPPPSIAATESATGFFRAFPLLQRVSHFCNTISTSSTLPRAAVAGVSQIARRLRWHRSIDPLWICRTSVTPVPLGSRIKRDGYPRRRMPRCAAPGGAGRRHAHTVRSCKPPKGVGILLVQVRMGRKERRKVAAVPTNTPRHEWPCWQLTGNISNQIANVMVTTQGTLDLVHGLGLSGMAEDR